MGSVIENGTIRVSSRETLEIEADRARLHIRVDGETFVYGNAALQRSREVAELVTRLKGAGLQDADITVASVQARVNQGVLTKNTRASFGLVITVRDLGILPDLPGAVSGVKHAELERARVATPARVDLGTEFRATQTIAATVSAEFFVSKAAPA